MFDGKWCICFEGTVWTAIRFLVQVISKFFSFFIYLFAAGFPTVAFVHAVLSFDMGFHVFAENELFTMLAIYHVVCCAILFICLQIIFKMFFLYVIKSARTGIELFLKEFSNQLLSMVAF
jgi:hypothetical protein